MSCCASCSGMNAQFDRRRADRDLARYRREGPLASTRQLIEALRSVKTGITSVLDIGCGVGAVGHEFLDRGVGRVTFVDFSEAYLAAARAESERRHTIGRVTYYQGDFVARADDISQEDVVVLDRVICCYPDMERLVSRAADRAASMVGAVYPRGDWWIRAVIAAENAVRRVRGTAFRAFVHSPAAIDAAFQRAGLGRKSVARGAIWTVAVYERAAHA
jgi:SAM-dependent methyltransferase